MKEKQVCVRDKDGRPGVVLCMALLVWALPYKALQAFAWALSQVSFREGRSR